MAKFRIIHCVEIACEYEASSQTEALGKAADFQRDHTVADLLDRHSDVWILEPKPDEE